MAEVLLFHHALGLTPGVVHFAETLRAAGHVVHVPDLYDGRVFDDLDEGVAYAREVGFDVVVDRGTAAADGLPEALVYAGFSLGAMPAQKPAQTRGAAAGALLLHGCVPPSGFGTSWPDAVSVQVHAMVDDPFFVEDRPAAEDLVGSSPSGELFLYPGSEHLFSDRSLAAYDAESAALLQERVLAFLQRVG